jgi:predicted ArsR family transcriptional regulator
MHGELTISSLASELQVTATAVRQRLGRLMEAKLVQRKAVTEGRGRPSHRYSLTELGRREAGGNFADLAVALWEEIRLISDPDVRRGLLQRIAGRMADSYGIDGKTTTEKMQAVAELFGERRVPVTVGKKGELPVLTANCCPYPALAEQDRSICAMEKMMFSEMVGEKLHLSECRLDGGTCCTFELSPSS